MDGGLTSDDVVGPGRYCFLGGGHERPGEQARVDALGLPHVHPISNAQPEDAGPAAGSQNHAQPCEPALLPCSL